MSWFDLVRIDTEVTDMCRAAPDELRLTCDQLQSMTLHLHAGRHLERSSTVGLVVFDSIGSTPVTLVKMYSDIEASVHVSIKDCMADSRLWNNLSAAVTAPGSLAIFKKQLKTSLLRLYTNDNFVFDLMCSNHSCY